MIAPEMIESESPEKRAICFATSSTGSPQANNGAGADLQNADGEAIGSVTSGGFGPTLGGPMALALVDVSAADAPIFADVRGSQVAMTREKLPFVQHNYKR